MAFCRTPVFRAYKKPNGKVVATDPDYLDVTTKVANTEGEYLILKGQGWTDHPQEALDRFEEEEVRVSDAAAERAYEDLKLSPAAQAEAAAYEKTTPKHVPEIPEAVKPPKPARKAK